MPTLHNTHLEQAVSRLEQERKIVQATTSEIMQACKMLVNQTNDFSRAVEDLRRAMQEAELYQYALYVPPEFLQLMRKLVGDTEDE